MSKKNNERKEKIKSLLLKTLHVICYILSIAFIGICVFSGVQSCHKTNKVSAESLTPIQQLYNSIPSQLATTYDGVSFDYVYSPRYMGSDVISLEDQISLISPFGVDLTIEYSEPQPVQYFNLIDINGYIFDGSHFFSFNQIKMSVATYLYTDAYTVFYYKFKLRDVFLYSSESDVYYYVCNKTDDSFSNYYNFPNDIKLLVNDSFVDSSALNYFFVVSEPSNFLFNPQFNYNSYLGTNILGAYGSNSFDQTSGAIRFKTFDVGYFISNGQLFDKIIYNVVESDGVYIVGRNSSGAESVIQAQNGYFVYTYLMYLNSSTNYSVIVNKHDQRPFQPSVTTDAFYYANSSTWTNDNYRHITFLQNLSLTNKNYIESFNNNNQNSYSGNIYVDGGDIFTLLGAAFYSLGDFFGLAILPGISIGVLFFLPLIVAIVVIMFHILKK